MYTCTLVPLQLIHVHVPMSVTSMHIHCDVWITVPGFGTDLSPGPGDHRERCGPSPAYQPGETHQWTHSQQAGRQLCQQQGNDTPPFCCYGNTLHDFNHPCT